MKPTFDFMLTYKKAVKEDLLDVVKLLSDDILGSKREASEPALTKEYEIAFQKIDADPNQELIVVIDERAELVGTLQLTFIQYLTYKGGLRAQIEAVRIRKDCRGKGIGNSMINWAVKRAKEKGAHLVQLTTDKQRPDAIKFYENLGFKSTHEGFKLHL